MGGNDVLNGTSLSDFLVGDYFDPAALDYWYDGIGRPPAYDSAIKGDDRLNGADGDDFLIDDLGNDTLYGGNGDDTFGVWVEQIGTNVYSGGEGYDSLYFEDSYNLGYDTLKCGSIILDAAASIEYVGFFDVGLAGTEGNDQFDFSGVESIDVYDEFGNYIYLFEADMGAGNDKFVIGDRFVGSVAVNGASGNDTIIGSTSGDTIDGGTGVDSMKGGQGWDIYIVDNASDIVVEKDDGGQPDEVWATASTYQVPENIEFTYYKGTGSFTGTGTKDSEWIFGGDKGDTLIGNGGNDVLIGGQGADSMKGGTGNDQYDVFNKSDLTVELKDEGKDIVVVREGENWTLGANIENLSYGGSSDFKGTGNELDNLIYGYDGNDSLFGLGGNDTLNGDVNADRLDGSSGKDKLNGEQGLDTLFGGTGADELIGGENSDVFVFNTALDGSNADKLSDYSVADDTMWLEKSGDGLFNTVALGALTASKFKVYGTGAIDDNDRILYDSAAGKIYYDADGSGATSRILFATVAPGTALTSADFLVI